MEKAKQLADIMAIDFELSIGWLGRWKENENITFHTVQGEKNVANVPGAEHWIQDVLPIALKGYAKRDIYKADETGLSYKALPRGTFAVRGIIHNLKVFYHQHLLQKQLIAIDKGESLGDFSKLITVLQALHMLKQALLLVKLEFIQNCFRKAAFPDDSCGNGYDNIRQQEDNMTSDCLPPALSIKEFTEWVSSDNDVACYGDLTDAEIFAQAQQTDICAEEDDDEEQEALRKPTRQEVLAALDTLRSYFDAEINEVFMTFTTLKIALSGMSSRNNAAKDFEFFFMITML
uniref:HTH CENPB-type domain-containing protein n=1 Tax=Plectus sambesii TaxID=2011161 RepID=A0A914X3S4_9BILA